MSFFFFFNDTATTEIYTLSLHDALPIYIHFQPKYVFAAIDAGCAAVRVNPGNIKAFDDKVAEIARAASAAGIPIRIGVNAGSLEDRKSTRLNSSHQIISYAVFCLKKKNKNS